ncbi:MATE family efflux transporter [Flavobacterium gawalongense]|uniref:Multidrug-efflux transporter n=1 Tax=Flavobacterium gawalongense TaxID=2594432 RepID=A0A553BQS6_9FLAO|nr:MATE family efflux transporter [Flavobacterium gawalongense]TRW99817.1 MATE family efflux transporter [Flavobacterium gawalongense]TRX04123.1 MATE family efflux transporter [Flavobacterium gawalongense]TRX10608.1 MATE family efflux transporter [Flavobacterium gawalongense]TRX11757.1 MATE family efflux transporter [Flavobacterium gawalongense]TRX29549.1 MATE family efflux transporter [Flavobacterium gawalongense]
MNLSQYTKEFSYNIKLAYPVILGMLGHTLIGIVDNFMVGKLGSTELAAVSLGNSFIFIALSLGIGFSTAITPLTAEADAENDDKKIRSTFHHGLLLCTVLGVALFILTVLSKQIMYLMHQPKAVADLAAPYIDWVAFSLIPVIMYQGYKQFADGLAKTKYSMYAIFMANVVHVFFNYVLIYGIWIFPKLGILGAALGTVLSRIMMVVFMHYLMKRNAVLEKYFKNFSFKEIRKSVLKKIINLGLPSAMQMLFEVTLFTAAIWLSGSLGKNSQAANQIALILASSTFMVAMGLSVTAMIRVSHTKGMYDYKNLIIVARSIFLLAIILETFFAIIFVVFHNFLPHLFLNMSDSAQMVDNKEIIIITSKLLLIAAIFQISDGIQVVVLGALRGLQDVKIPMYITFVAYWIIGFPISYYLGKYTELKAVGIWIGLLAGLTAAALFLYIRFAGLTRKLVLKNHKN